MDYSDVRDSSKEVLQFQQQVFLRKSDAERFDLTISFIEDIRNLNLCSLKSEHPDWMEIEIQMKLFEKIYSDDFSKEEFQKILEHRKNFLEKNINK